MSDQRNSASQVVTVFGGSGFIGRYVVGALARKGWQVVIACRNPDRANSILSLGAPEQIEAVHADLHDPTSVQAALQGSCAAVNMVGILAETPGQKFVDIQSRGAQIVANAVAAMGIKRFVHFSAIGANPKGLSAYARTKSEGETSVLETVPSVVVVRPSVVFGPEDNFLNCFATMAKYFPVLPIVGADTNFQPVYVGDVAEAVTVALSGRAMPGKIYELGGPDIRSFFSIIDFVMKMTGHRRYVIKLGFGAGNLMAQSTQLFTFLSCGFFPQLLRMTSDQVELLKYDNVVSQEAIADGRTLEGLGITPKSIEMIAINYLRKHS